MLNKPSINPVMAPNLWSHITASVHEPALRDSATSLWQGWKRKGHCHQLWQQSYSVDIDCLNIWYSPHYLSSWEYSRRLMDPCLLIISLLSSLWQRGQKDVRVTQSNNNFFYFYFLIQVIFDWHVFMRIPSK